MKHPQPFLYHVAQDLKKKYGNDMSHLTLVFPNKRASLFFNEYLASINTKPVWCPSYTTISELFQSHSKLKVADEIKLILDLHHSFTTCTDSTETLDQFFGWGKVLLKDFDDIDKSMADAHQIFLNISDLHSYDTADYLTDEQISVLKHFFKDFDEHQTSKLREKFLKLWSRLGTIYNHYKDHLSEQGLSYEGSLYREVVERDEEDYGENIYTFIGFNVLQEVERKLFHKLQSKGQAIFYWDYDRYYTRPSLEGNLHEAGNFILKYINEFPNQLDDEDDSIYNNLEGSKTVVFTGSPTDSLQARYVGKWLQDNDRVSAGNRTAIVMCNENLLPTILHSIPSNVKDINITTGFPLSQTSAASMVVLLCELAFMGSRGRDKYSQKHVTSILRHPYSEHISPLSTTLCKKIVTEHRYYPSREELTLDEGLQLLFMNLNESNSAEEEHNLTRVVNKWLSSIIKRIATSIREKGTSSPLDQESLFRIYKLINRLQSLIDNEDLKVDAITYQRLLLQLISSTKIPFHGEPAIGLQIMGVLETRNLDFEHLLVLSCNEGNMPKGEDNTSFIPQSIRKAFGLPTMDMHISIYAFYFFRLLQRARDITIMYGNSGDDKNSGEKSRFLLQLMVESRLNITRKALSSKLTPMFREHIPIEKTDMVIARLNAIKTLSPTAINTYIRCPLQFFYQKLAGIKELESESEEIDTRMFGNIFHEASQFIYEEMTGADLSIDPRHAFAGSGHLIQKSQIETVLNESTLIERSLDKAFMKNLFKSDNSRMKPEYNGLQIINRKVILHYLRQLLRIDQKTAPFIMRGLEGDAYTTIKIENSQGEREIEIGGRIDRLDEITDINGNHYIRVVDYKTGYSMVENMPDIEAVFMRENLSNHSDYFLQAMLYSLIVSKSHEINPKDLPVAPALLFIQRANKENYNPILKIKKEEITDIRKYNDIFEKKLSEIVSEIMEPTLPFTPTDDRKTCSKCIYSSLCGRIVKK